MATFRDRLIEARSAAGLSQAEFGRLVGAAQSTVASWERAKEPNEPDFQTVRRIAKVVGRTPEWLAFAVADGANGSLALIPEVDIHAGSGDQGLMEIGFDDADAEKTLRRYGFPRDDFRAIFGVSPDGVRIVSVKGDSMLPTLLPGERVLIDTSDRTASPPGIFILWDGLGLVIKRVEYVAHSDPPTVRIISDNQRYQPYERRLDEAAIQGRIIGSLMRR